MSRVVLRERENKKMRISSGVDHKQIRELCSYHTENLHEASSRTHFSKRWGDLVTFFGNF